MSKLEIYDLEHNYITTLANAYNVGYSKEENQLWDASFQLPYGDPQLKYCRPLRFIKIYDNEDEYIGEFRIWPSEKKKSMSDRQVKIELLDCLHTLTDSVLFGYYQLNNYKTDYVFNWLLNKQKNKRWIPGRVDFQRGFSYAWENENGLVDALFSIPKPFDEDWIIERDTTVYPWKLSLVKPQTEVTARIIEGYNLKEFTVKESPQKLVNRVYALGDGEGVNQLTFKTINNGKAYVEDTDSQSEYGLIEYIWTDRRFKDKASQKASAEGMLRNWKELQYTWEITALDLMKLANRPSNLAINQGREIKANELRLGKVIELITEDNEPIQFRILKESKSDIDDGKANIQLTLGNFIGNTGTTIADVERQQEINTNYANGATNIVPYIFDREADSSNPVEFKFFVDDDVRNVNTCELTVDTSHFRATSKGNTSSPQTVSSSTSSAGGASVQSATSSAGGASVQSATSSAGGSSTQTSSANGSHRHKMFTFEGVINYDWGLDNTANVFMGFNRNLPIYVGGSSQSGDLYTAEAADNHTHTVSVPAHTHNVSINIPAHTHSVSINIPAHTHQVSITIPGHTHEIIYGIFEYANFPSKLKIEVDGNTVPIDSTSFERFNVVPYLTKDEDGKVTRGRHTLKITPNDLARIEVQLILRVFIQSQLGGEF